jgi:hypothetical protein
MREDIRDTDHIRYPHDKFDIQFTDSGYKEGDIEENDMQKRDFQMGGFAVLGSFVILDGPSAHSKLLVYTMVPKDQLAIR